MMVNPMSDAKHRPPGYPVTNSYDRRNWQHVFDLRSWGNVANQN